MKKCESYIIICDDVCGIVGRREVVQLLRIVHNIVPSLMLQSGAKKPEINHQFCTLLRLKS